MVNSGVPIAFQLRSFPYRRTARRLRWKECQPGAWDSEQWLSPHRITSTYRHIDISTWHVSRTSFLCQELSYMIYDVISFQTCSNSGTFTFHVKSFQICPFQEPSYLMWFFFSNFPFQELTHLMWFLFRNCHFQELSHFMYFFSDLFCFRKNRIWHDFLFLSSNSGNRSCCRGLSFFWAGFLSDDLISKKQGPFQFQTWGGNYVVDIVHVRYIYIII